MDAKLKALLADPSKKMDAAELSYLAACFRRTMFSVLHERGTGHWGGAASAAELVTSLYFNRLRINPADPQWADRDRFILSKGHASVNLYTVLAARGFFSEDLLPSFRTLGSILQGHPAMLKVPGVDMSTGALGHGLSVGLGMAMAAKLSGINVQRVKRGVYAIMGLLVAVASVLQVSRIGSMDYANAGSGYEMDAIAAVIVGGTSMSGGRGSIIGTVLGVLIIAVMNNLLNLLGVPPFLREAFKGFIVIGAVLLQKKEKI